MATRTFTINTKTAQQPLVVTDDALEDFRAQGLAAMNACLERIRARLHPDVSGNAPPSHQRLVGEMMIDGYTSGNTRKMILCALWMAHTHPDVNGLISNGVEVRFLREDDARDTHAVHRISSGAT